MGAKGMLPLKAAAPGARVSRERNPILCVSDNYTL